MHIAQVDYGDFRSVKKATLNKCGQLNVLIGQNNSGKSNLLKGIVSFFASLRPATLVDVNNNDHSEDLHVKDGETATAASISIVFTLTPDEQEDLISDLAKEAPQLKNALDDLEPRMLLRVTQNIATSPDMVYVSEITLVAPSGSFEKVLLKMSRASSEELYERASYSRTTTFEIGRIESLREELVDNERVGTSLEDPSFARRFISRRGSMRNESFRDEVIGALEASSTVAAAQASLTELIAQRHEAIEQTRLAPLKEAVETFAGNSNRIPGYVENILTKVSSIKVLYLDENRKPVGEEEARRLLSLKMRRGGGAELRAIQTTVSGLLGVQIDAFESAQTGITRIQPGLARTPSSPAAEMDVDNFLVQVNGSGIREALRLMLDVQFEGPHVLLLEEPEVHLHPALEYNLLQYLKKQSSERQVFLTTHSTNFLDTAEDSNVYLVQKKQQSSEVQRLTIDDLEEELPRELGIRLSSVFMFDRLVFVEGPSDELVLRELAFRLGVNLAQHNVGFVQMGGARGFAQYVNAAVIDMLTKRNVRLHFIIDRDERAQEELAKMARACDSKASLHVLRKRELENYLIQPTAISGVITKKSQGRVRPEASEISEFIKEAADSLKGRTIARHALQRGCKSLLFDRSDMSEVTDSDFVDAANRALERMSIELDEMKNSLDAVKNEVEQQIQASWERDKLDLVPGADLLDVVFQKFGLRYRKDRDAVALVRPLESADIDLELVKILREIVM